MGRPSPALSRRDVLLRGVALGAVVWAAPAIAKLPAASGAAGTEAPCSTECLEAVGTDSHMAFEDPGTHCFVVPAGVTSITVEAWGAGGHGAPYGNQGGGGGGGGGYASSTIEDVQAVCTISVTVGGAGGDRAGGASWVTYRSQEVRADGGSNATGRDGALGGGGSGTLIRVGGTGGRGSGNSGGGGGAAAGPDGDGADGQDGTGNAGGSEGTGGAGGVGVDGSGSGGRGGDRNQAGVAGSPSGGAGGGAGRGGPTFGTGAPGLVRISWEPTSNTL